MKVGIITFCRANNYGAVLQCFALQETLKSFGHDVQIINYKQPFVEENNKLFSMNFIRHHKKEIKKIVMRFTRHLPYRAKVCKYFNDFRKKFLSLTVPCNQNCIPNNFDAFIIGSDQLWTTEHTGNKLDPVFTANFNNSHALIYSYAISSNEKSIQHFNIKDLSNIAHRFRVLSFREQNICDYVSSKLNVKCRCDIDPTLLALPKIWEPLINTSWEQKKYIVVYQARALPGKERLLFEKARKLAEKQQWGIIDLSSYKFSPSDFVSIIKYAQCVVTTSFHGAAFALRFNRPLWVVQLNDGHDGRCTNLLKLINAEKCICKLEEDLQYIPELDYNDINDQLAQVAANSIKYLKGL